MSLRFSFTRVRFTEAASRRLGQMKTNTGLTQNVLCRIALAQSLSESEPISSAHALGEPGALDINREILLGKLESVFFHLISERRKRDRELQPDSEGLEELTPDELCIAHIHRGVNLIWPKMRKGSSLTVLVD